MNDLGTPRGLRLTRRGFLIGAAGTGFVMAFARASLVLPEQAAQVVATRSFDPNLWFRIDADGTITVHVIRAEMGQHVGTALARILADELEADWSQVRVEHVDSDPKWGLMVTGGSWSVWQSFPLLSQAGAAGRTALIEEAAKLLGVPAASLQARNSVVSGAGRSITYAQIVQRGDLSRSWSADELKAMPVKAPAERRLVGVDTQALDIPGKTDGKGVYGIDAHIDGMVHAAPVVPPTRNGSKAGAVDETLAKQVKGYQGHLVLDDPSGTVPGWVLALADSTWAAMQAARRLKVTWNNDDTAEVSEQQVLDHAAKLIADANAGARVVEGPVEDAFAKAASSLEAEYTTASVLHFQLEPVNALALQKDGVWEIHTGNQWQSLILPTLAKALGVGEDKVVLRTYLLGGGFGRRLNGDYTVPAALASKALGGKPVKLTLTREDDARFDSIRSASLQKLRMGFDATGKVVAMQHDACAGWPTQVMAGALLGKAKGNGAPYDPFAISGADHWYTVGAHRVRAISNDLANRVFRPGWLRSVGPGWTNWALESFMDEAAHQRGQDPLAFRLALLDATGDNAGSAPNAVGGAARQAGVLRRVAELAGWGQTLPPDTGLGIATSFGQERDMPTWVACVARVKVDRQTGHVQVEQLSVVTDCGTVVHPDGALAQTEGATLWGLSMALHEGTLIEHGQVRDINLNSYTPLRIADVPPLQIEFIPSTEASVGLGEPATTVVAPAIGNAIFAAVGARVRHLPITQEAVRKALKG